MQIVAQAVNTATASEKAWQKIVFMIPLGGCPTIYPALYHLDGVRNPASSQDTEASFKINMALGVNKERTEQSVEAFLNSIVKGVLRNLYLISML